MKAEHDARFAFSFVVGHGLFVIGFAEEREHDSKVDYIATLADMTERDRRDTSRADSPLKVASDAIVIDSTGLSINEVFARMMAVVGERQKEEGSRQ